MTEVSWVRIPSPTPIGSKSLTVGVAVAHITLNYVTEVRILDRQPKED